LEDQPVETTLYSLASRAPDRPQRRQGERYLSLLRVGALTIDGRRELCLIRNVSAGGMMLRAYSGVDAGTRLTIELKQGEPVSGVARWVQDGCVGVTFDSPIDVVALIAPTSDGPRPRMPRIEVDCTAWVRQGADVHRARAVNVSQGGICVRCRTELSVDAEVTVTLPGLSPAHSVVKWRDGDLYGIGFNRVVTLQQLVPWLKEEQARLTQPRLKAG
jgi:PilZ domain